MEVNFFQDSRWRRLQQRGAATHEHVPGAAAASVIWQDDVECVCILAFYLDPTQIFVKCTVVANITVDAEVLTNLINFSPRYE
jgi:hypothetical protein